MDDSVTLHDFLIEAFKAVPDWHIVDDYGGLYYYDQEKDALCYKALSGSVYYVARIRSLR